MAFLLPMAGGAAIALAYKYFTKPPPNPPPAPTPEMTQKALIKSAREKLGMDVENHYNFGVCGSSGTGLSALILMLIFSSY
jgi:hypothetical protein